MYAKLNNIFNIIVKGLFETAIISISGILLIFLFAEIDSTSIINRIIAFSLVNYLCAYYLNSYVLIKIKSNFKKKYITIFFAVFLSLVSSLVTSSETIVICFIIYLFGWYRSFVSIVEDRDIQSTKKIFIISLLVYLFIILIISLTNGESATAQKLKMFFPIYVGSALSYFAITNIEVAYNKRNSNSLNKAKNIRIINLISFSLIIIVLAFTLTGFFDVWKIIFSSKLFNAISSILQKIGEIIIYPIALFITKIGELIYRKADFSILERLNNGEISEEIENIPSSTLSSNTQFIIDLVFNIVKWSIVISIIFIIIFYIIKAISNISLLSENEENEEEEKEFILSPKEMRKRIGKSLKRLILNVSMAFSKSRNNIYDIPVIRRIYLDTILTLKEKGYEFANNHTPNEFLSTLNKSKYINTGIRDLTRIYNEYRYGRIEPTEEEIENCINVKSNIIKINNQQ
ncbi:DUF4129 domain-containing protein [Proteiniborus sp.]|uniref:DUF4129 domain-containing protein n=1 Tax=Proteiniborus sp. TaxID=2079015 RepID=UPI003333821F